MAHGLVPGRGVVRVAYDSACSANEKVQAAEYNEMRMAGPLGVAVLSTIAGLQQGLVAAKSSAKLLR